jgi:hypothetical protein
MKSSITPEWARQTAEECARNPCEGEISASRPTGALIRVTPVIRAPTLEELKALDLFNRYAPVTPSRRQKNYKRIPRECSLCKKMFYTLYGYKMHGRVKHLR